MGKALAVSFQQRQLPGPLYPLEQKLGFLDSTCKFYEQLIYFKVVLTDQNICNLFHAATNSPCSLSQEITGKPCVSSGVGFAHCPSHCFSTRVLALDLQDWQCPAMARPFPNPWLHYWSPAQSDEPLCASIFRRHKTAHLMMITSLQLSPCSCFLPHFI